MFYGPQCVYNKYLIYLLWPQIIKKKLVRLIINYNQH